MLLDVLCCESGKTNCSFLFEVQATTGVGAWSHVTLFNYVGSCVCPLQAKRPLLVLGGLKLERKPFALGTGLMT